MANPESARKNLKFPRGTNGKYWAYFWYLDEIHLRVSAEMNESKYHRIGKVKRVTYSNSKGDELAPLGVKLFIRPRSSDSGVPADEVIFLSVGKFVHTRMPKELRTPWLAKTLEARTPKVLSGAAFLRINLVNSIE